MDRGPAKNPTKFGPKAKDAAVANFKITANRCAAAEASGVNVSTVNYYMTHDPEFRARMDHAKGLYVEGLEREAHRRAMEGYDEPRMGAGGSMYNVRKFSDTLLLHMMKKKAPAEHGDSMKIDQHTVVEEAPIDFSKLSAESRQQLREILQRESDEGEAE